MSETPMTSTQQIVQHVRHVYKIDTISDDDLGESISEATVKLAMAGALKHDKGSTPKDVVILLRALTHLVAEQGMDMAMIIIAQQAGMAAVNNGGMTYGCLSADGPEGDPKMPFTVLLSCNRKNMPYDQLAEFILRESPGVRTERREA